jgi:hypothetical protein
MGLSDSECQPAVGPPDQREPGTRVARDTGHDCSARRLPASQRDGSPKRTRGARSAPRP